MITGTKFDIEKFDGMNDFRLWQVRMKALLEQQGLAAGGVTLQPIIYGYDVGLRKIGLQNMMTEAKGNGGEGLYMRGRSGQRDMEHDTYSAWSKSQGRSSQVSGSGIDGYDNADVMMAMKYDGGNILLGDDKECCVRRTGEVHVQMRNGSSFVLDNVSDQEDIEGSTQQRTKSGVAKHLGVAGLQQQNGLVEKINVTLLAKMPIDMLGFFGWLANIKQGMLEPVKVKCIFLGYRKGVEFEVEPHEDHAFEVEPQGNVDHVAGSHKIQTQDLMDYHSARDREQHSTRELFGNREDSNEAAYAFVVVDKIYAHELLTFNDTVSCEVISKWKAALKEYMDAWSDVYVLSNSCRKSSEDRNDYYWEYTPAKGNVLGMKIVRDQSGNTLRVSQSKFYNEKLNGKWLCIYAVGSQEYQVVCTRPDITSADVDRSLSWVDQSHAAYMTLTEAAKEAIWLKGLAIESGFELNTVAGIATGALPKVIPGPRFQHRLNLLSIGIG
ncbi:hypothetical protein Tco_0648095 [Tanacetum coccineum]